MTQTLTTRHHGTATLHPVDNDPNTFMVVRGTRTLGAVTRENSGWTAVVYPGPAKTENHVTRESAAVTLMATLR